MGVVHTVSSYMPYWIISIYGQPITETTVQHVNCDDMLSPYIAMPIEVFDQTLKERLDDTNFIIYKFYGFGV